MTFHTGDQIYKFSLIEKLGSGGYGEVWLADDNALGVRCALKLLAKDSVSVNERLLEARIGNRLNHAHVVNIKYADVATCGNPPQDIVLIAMPYLPNGAITTKLNCCNFLELSKAYKCLSDVLRGLEYLHECGFYHCDIKPNNILLGNNSEYMLSDYGITCYSPTHAAVQPRSSYVPHISPETISTNSYDARTDIYQLGLTAFRLVNGISEIKDECFFNQRAFYDNVLTGKIVTDARFQPYVPTKIRRIIIKACATDPADRYQTAVEMRRDLEKIALRGNCTADDSGRIIFSSGDYDYRYEILPAQGKRENLVAYKKNRKSGRETRATKYCLQAVTHREALCGVKKMANDLL